MQIQTTKNSKVSPVVLIYGAAGVGKTFLANPQDCSDAVVIDVDMGLSSLRSFDVPFLSVRKPEDIKNCLEMARLNNFGYPKGEGFKTIILDDLTELGLLWLRTNKSSFKNPMKAYGELADWAMQIIHDFRALSEIGFNVVFLCKEEKIQDHTTGGLIWNPAFPGKQIQGMLDYLVGEVFHMEIYVDPNDESQEKKRVFRTMRTPQIAAKSRYGKFGELEYANLNSIFSRMKEEV